MKSKQYLLILAFAASSWSAIAQPAMDAESKLEMQKNEAINCQAAIEAVWKTSVLETKLPFDGTKPPTLEQLSNRSKPTTKEKASLLKFVDGLDGCNAISMEWKRKNLPREFLSLVTNYWSESKFIFADLYAGTITYSDAAKKRASLAADWNSKRNALVESYQAQAAADQQRKQQDAENQKRIADAQFQRQVEVNERRIAYERQLEQQQAQLNLMQQQAAEARRQSEMNSALNLLQMAQPKPANMLNNRSTSCVTKFRNGNAYTDCD